MPFPAPVERIDEEQERVGRPLPAGLRERLLVSNGGDLFVEDEEWTLFSVWDPTSKRTAARSSSHIARETAALYAALEGVLAPGFVAVAENGSGDYLLIDQSSRPLIWRHESNALDEVDVDWARNRPRARRPSHRAEAVDRVMAGLTALGADSSTTVVIEAPETGIYVQFAAIPGGFVGEAVGEGNLSKLLAYHVGPRMRAKLTGLGWTAPVDPSIDHGNWTQTWPSSSWDAKAVARLVVRTVVDAYGLEPWALAVSLGTK